MPPRAHHADLERLPSERNQIISRTDTAASASLLMRVGIKQAPPACAPALWPGEATTEAYTPSSQQASLTPSPPLAALSCRIRSTRRSRKIINYRCHLTHRRRMSRDRSGHPRPGHRACARRRFRRGCRCPRTASMNSSKSPAPTPTWHCCRRTSRGRWLLHP